MQAKSYLSPSDRERINGELRDIRARRKATADVPEGDGRYMKPREFEFDDGKLARRESELKTIIERDSPPKLDPVRKNKAFQEFRGLVKEWEDNSLTKYDQGLGYPMIMAKMGHSAEIDFERAKVKCQTWEMAERGKFVGARLKELAGVLDPDNPHLRNLENFRRRK